MTRNAVPKGERVQGRLPEMPAYTCSKCGTWDPDGGGCAPPITGPWFCRGCLGAALDRAPMVADDR